MSVEAEPRVFTPEEAAAIEECHRIALDSARHYFGVDREDLIQSTSLKIADRVSRSGIPGGEDFEPRAYTRRVMTNTLINMKNKGGKDHPGENLVGDDLALTDSAYPSAEEEFMSGLFSGDVQQALDTLHPTHRSVILSRAAGLSVDETADRLGKARGTVMSSTSRAKDHMAAQLTGQAGNSE